MIREWLETQSARDRKGANRGKLSLAVPCLKFMAQTCEYVHSQPISI